MTYDEYEKLKKLEELKTNGTLTEEEFQREKERILNEETRQIGQTGQAPASTKQPLFGLQENAYLMLMHLSQFAGWILPGLGFVLPIAMWLTNKDENENVDKHGKNILNFTISYFIYAAISGILVIIAIGLALLAVLGVVVTIVIIIAAVKAYNNEYWDYPLTIKFLK